MRRKQAQAPVVPIGSARISRKDSFEQFRALQSKRKKRDDGSNDDSGYVEIFLASANQLLNNYDTFDMTDLYSMSRFQPLPSETFQEFFSKFIDVMISTGQVQKLPSIYESPIYKNVYFSGN